MIFLNTQISLKPCKISKTIGKIMWIEILLKLKYCGVQSLWQYYFIKEYILLFFHFNHNLKDDNEIVLLDLKIDWGLEVAFFQMNLLNDKESVCSPFIVYQTCRGFW